MKLGLRLVTLIGLLLPFFAQAATLTIREQNGMSESWVITSTNVRNADNGYELALTTNGVSCFIPKAVAEQAGYSLGELQTLVASSADGVSIGCFGLRGGQYKSWAMELLIQTASKKVPNH